MGNQNSKRFDSAFLIKDQQAIATLQEDVIQYFKQAAPLISTNYQTRNVDLACEIAKIEAQHASMLEKYDNYQIALLNYNQIENVQDITWMIKDSHGVILQNHNLLKQGLCNKSYTKELSISIYEPITVNAFKNYFMDVWDEIPSINKE